MNFIEGNVMMAELDLSAFMRVGVLYLIFCCNDFRAD